MASYTALNYLNNGVIKNLNYGHVIIDYFKVLSASYAKYKNNDLFYIIINLSDDVDLITGIWWVNLEKYHAIDRINEICDKIIKIRGRTSFYKDKIEILINENGILEIIDLSNEQNYLQDIINKINLFCNDINDLEYKNLLNLIFKDEEILNSFINAPASTVYHQSYRHGLIEHTHNVVQNCLNILKGYPSKHLDIDLLITAALVHDLGKIELYKRNDKMNYELTDTGKLNKHSQLTCKLISKKIQEMGGMSSEKEARLLHLIDNHSYKKYENITLLKEYEILSKADQIDAALN